MTPGGHRCLTAVSVGAAVVAVATTLGIEDLRQAAFLAIGSGAFVAAIGIAIVLTYRGSGVINFAAGAIATYVAFAYNGLRNDGELFLPPLPNPLALVEGGLHRLGADGVDLPSLPTVISVGAPQTFAAAFGISIAVAAMLGGLLHLLVFRPLQHAPPLAKVVASVGAMLVLQASLLIRFGPGLHAVRRVLDPGPRQLTGVAVFDNQLWLAAAVVAAAVLLWALFRFTLVGIATRGAAENEKAAVLLGHSPSVLGGLNWVLSSVLCGVFGVLLATVNTTLDASSLTFLVVPALGAALLGGLSSFGLTVAAGFGLAMAQSCLEYLGTQDWFPKADGSPLPGLQETLPLLLIVLLLVVRGQAVPERGDIVDQRLPRATAPRRPGIVVLGLVVIPCVAAFVLPPDWRFALQVSLIAAVVCLSLVVLTGLLGQISLAQMAFAGVSGFALSNLTTEAGVPFPVAPLVAALVAMVFGLVTALPALRLRGVTLAVVTLSGALAVESFVFRNSAWSGGLEGAPIPPPSFLGLDFGPSAVSDLGDGQVPGPWFVIFCAVVFAGLLWAVARLRGSHAGRRMLAVRSNERAAAGVGIGVVATKIVAFGLAAFIAGVGGVLSGYNIGTVTPARFGAFASVIVLVFAYLGGIGSVWGAVFGGMLVTGGLVSTAMTNWFSIDAQYTLLVGGLGVVVATIKAPEGLAQLVAARRRAPLPPATVPTTRAAERVEPPSSPLGRPDPVLEVEHLTVYYGGVVAVDEVSLSVTSGRLVALIGPNGAGKTTTLDAITGFVRSAGDVRLAGRSIGALAPHRRTRLGLARTWQSVELFGDLTVAENVEAALRDPDPGAAVQRALARVGVDHLGGRLPGELSNGEQKLVGVARALASDPLVLCMDEPAAGLDDAESAALGRTLRSLADDGTAILLVDHDMAMVLDQCDDVYVLEFGRVIAQGTPAEIRSDDKVVAAYLGSRQVAGEAPPL